MGWIIWIFNLFFKVLGIGFGVAKRDWNKAIDVTRKNISDKKKLDYE